MSGHIKSENKKKENLLFFTHLAHYPTHIILSHATDIQQQKEVGRISNLINH